ncbi:hypothetical protein GLYMA_02G143900v4 [Glycine max]|uniref:Uncharacterized protein n=2 Tax=Glycine subgen. Soja TaxID=1462606 RepID=K7K8C5_SOYBN|nr:hypothetical protein JHK87_003988 [Glycine soja]KAG5063110.1 hypothetical protein JHK85_004293 [Glycine max]KAG5080064.1 hypothetical protein JHK86_004129 [Glycine max]KAH1060317.1 hypothetical protein GYH30_004008 [Glycine max]KAH1060318.1 hypothetical protein GYH30_004008 [Glycine max]
MSLNTFPLLSFYIFHFFYIYSTTPLCVLTLQTLVLSSLALSLYPFVYLIFHLFISLFSSASQVWNETKPILSFHHLEFSFPSS